MKTAPTRRRRNPYIGFGYAAVWVLVAICGFLILSTEWGRLLRGEMGGTRTAGFALFTPPIAAGLGAIGLVRAALAVRPWSRYVATTTAMQRQQLGDEAFTTASFTPLIVGGVGTVVAWLGLVVLILVRGQTFSSPGMLSMIMVVTLLGLAGVTMAAVGVRGTMANRRRQTASDATPPASPVGL